MKKRSEIKMETTLVFFWIQILLCASQYPDPFTLDIWTNFTLEHGEMGMYELGDCLALSSCEADNTEAHALYDAVQRQIGDNSTTYYPYDGLKGCSCDLEDCTPAGSCCGDLGVPNNSSLVFKCVTLYDKSIRPFYANVECPTDYPNDEIAERCKTPINATSAKPDLAHWIVTSNTTRHTYRNIYCALCNGESVHSLLFWDLELDCPQPEPQEAVTATSTSTSTSTSTALPVDSPLTSANQQINFYNSECTVRFNEKDSALRRSCVSSDIVIECPDSYSNSAIRERCLNSAQVPIGTQTDFPVVWYRNIYCAICNGEDLVRLTCGVPAEGFVSTSLRVLVQPFGDGCKETLFWRPRDDPECQTLQPVLSSCSLLEIFDWSSQQCVSLCNQPFQWEDGECVLPTPQISFVTPGAANASMPAAVVECANLSFEDFHTKLSVNDEYSVSHYGEGLEANIVNSTETICTKCNWYIYDKTDYKTLDEGSEVILSNGQTYDKPYYLMREDNSIAVCSPGIMPERSILGVICFHIEDTVSLVLMCISIVCLAVMILFYVLLPALHNVPGYIVLSKITAMFCGQLFFLLRVPAGGSSVVCHITAVITHYAFLAAYFWSVLLAVEIVRTIKSMYTVNQQSRKKFIKYSAVGWSVPLIPVIVALVMDSWNSSSELAPQYGLPQCWLNSSYGLYIYFLIPMAVMFIVSVLLYIVVVVRFSVLAYQSRGVRQSHNEKIIVTVKLFFAFGLLWVFGLLAAIFPENRGSTCLFTFVNSLSGVLIPVVFLANSSVYQSLKKFIREKRNGGVTSISSHNKTAITATRSVPNSQS